MSRTLILKMAILLSFSLFATSCGDDDKNADECDATFVVSCSGNVAQTCVDKKIAKTDCGTKTCDAGVCVEAQTDVCDATFKTTCVGNVAQACVDKKIVKTDCGTKTCDAGVCVEPQADVCDASFKATCVGNVAQTCVDKKIVKTDCGTKTCDAGVCVEPQTDVCDASFKATCVGNVAQTCVDKKIVKTDCGTDPCTAGVCAVTEPAQGNACTNDICHKGQLYQCDGKVYEAPISCGPQKVCSTDSMHISYCLESCSEAENGHTKKVCEDDYGPYLASMICGLDSLGQYVYDENLKVKPIDCPASCSNGACVKLTDDDGTACDFKKFEERCEAGFVVYCGERYDSKNDKYFYVVSTFVCDVEQVPAVSCQIKKETNYAACVAPCTQGDPIKGTCERDYISYTLHTNACTEAKGDTSAFYYFPSESSENCKTCDEKTLSCTK